MIILPKRNLFIKHQGFPFFQTNFQSQLHINVPGRQPSSPVRGAGYDHIKGIRMVSPTILPPARSGSKSEKSRQLKDQTGPYVHSFEANIGASLGPLRPGYVIAITAYVPAISPASSYPVQASPVVGPSPQSDTEPEQ